jgi:ABC-type Fe3+ transport system permease subunit
VINQVAMAAPAADQSAAALGAFFECRRSRSPRSLSFGLAPVPRPLLAFLVSFFPMTINAAIGFRMVDEEGIAMARGFMGSRWQIFRTIRLPNALPYLFGGMKISITLAIIGVIVATRPLSIMNANNPPTM